MPHSILLIDDDEHLAEPLATYLQRFDLQLRAETLPSRGLARLRAEVFDAVILDVMLPEMDGFELCRTIRRGTMAASVGAALGAHGHKVGADLNAGAATPAVGTPADVPILMLTARGDVTDRVVGLELGADDYLPKPFEPRELAARLQTILRRRLVVPLASTQGSPAAGAGNGATLNAASPQGQGLHFEGLDIDLQRRSVRRLGEPVELTGTEFELLVLLAREPQKVFSRDEILNRLRGRDAELLTRAVDILVSRLRKKLEPLPAIKTLRNVGYTFVGAPL